MYFLWTNVNYLFFDGIHEKLLRIYDSYDYDIFEIIYDEIYGFISIRWVIRDLFIVDVPMSKHL